MRVTGKAEHDVKQNVFEVLALTGLSPKAACLPQQLSGGEQQRVCIARALVNKPDIILADEPTGNLDGMVSKEIVTLFQKINSMGTTVVMATHDKSLIEAFSHRTIELTHGHITSDTLANERSPE
jgi:cell division transport system ATP-binding protein